MILSSREKHITKKKEENLLLISRFCLSAKKSSTVAQSKKRI
jgi:hypothetical protein